MLYAESRQREIFWNPGPLGDSDLSNIKAIVKYCSPSVGCNTEMSSISPIRVAGLEANQTYNYTISIMDSVFNKTSLPSEVNNFTTAERGKTKEHSFSLA